MKKIMFSLAFMLIGSFAFANTNEVKKTNKEMFDVVLAHDCTYRIVNSRGETVGTVIVQDVPDNVSCHDASAKKRALEIWHDAN